MHPRGALREDLPAVAAERGPDAGPVARPAPRSRCEATLNPPARDSRGQKAGPRYLTGRVRVEHFAVDDEPELLPVPLALLTPAEVAADGGALSGGGHLAEGSKRGGQGSCGWTRFRRDLNDTETGLRGIRAALESGRSGKKHSENVKLGL